MKQLKLFAIFMIACLIMPFMLSAQDDSNYQMFWVHEDRVMPSKVADYEKAAKLLAEKCAEYNVDMPGWITSQTMDWRYMYVTPIKSLSDINFDGMGELREKMGAEAFDQMFADMNDSYKKHGDYVLTMDKELTYMPEGITQTPEGENYRKFWYLHTTPGKAKKLREKMLAVKELYESKGSSAYYRVYRNGFGTMGDFLLVAAASKDGVTFETAGAANDKLLGEEAQPIFMEVMKYITKIEEMTGQMRPDLAYSPNISN